LAGLSLLNTCIKVVYERIRDLHSSLTTEFARRYLPRLDLVDQCINTNSVVYWVNGSGFQILSELYSSISEDQYVVAGDLPYPYINESPVFFLLQVLARSLARNGYVVLTDSVSINLGSRNVLLLGYPHTGKSTITALAVSRGFKVYSTENTVVRAGNGGLEIVAGTRVLVYDPRIRDLFGVRIESTSRTKHGYEVLDLEQLNGDLKYPAVVDEVYLIYTSFNSRGFSGQPVKGRKVDKTIWYFATSLLKGLDYYPPRPLDTPIDEPVLRTLKQLLDLFREKYSDRFHEVFGSPIEVFEGLIKS
jgi:hypothetical protein